MKHIGRSALIPAIAGFIMAGCSGSGAKAVDTETGDDTGSLLLLVGSYAPADSAGIKVYQFDIETAETTPVSELSGVLNPSYLAVDSGRSMIYSVSEAADSTAAVCAIKFDRDSRAMTLIDRVETGGGAPCYIALTPDRRYAVSANYLGGNISIFPIDSAGRLSSPRTVDFTGSGPVLPRQSQPHLHCISFTPDSAYMLANDLGSDRIHRFRLDDDSLADADSESPTDLLPGSGPRHTVWDKSGRHAYLINEISGAVTVFDYDGSELVARQYIQADTLGAQGSGDIHISNDGRHLYASNRLKGDGIAIFSIDSVDGTLTKTGYQPTGPHPRNFIITPDDRYLLVACRDSDAIEIYSRNPETGLIAPTGREIRTSRPVCLKWL